MVRRLGNLNPFKSLLSEKGVPVGSNKAELIARLKAPKKALKAFEAKTAKKTKKVSVVGSFASVIRGTKKRTKGGLTKGKLMKAKDGKIVSKAHHKAGKKAYKANGLAKWTHAVPSRLASS
eukprot:TRINITY_DN8341_c0_g2_i1.p1 TRINITY_DN8341_c0_g2~~TRINITY_DN8341_c0_g2_i1.p1  ORF type:complete len:121 (-),score=29.89 TRINITY_DN8341_c0_g2_i1:223-585(-)